MTCYEPLYSFLRHNASRDHVYQTCHAGRLINFAPKLKPRSVMAKSLHQSAYTSLPKSFRVNFFQNTSKLLHRCENCRIQFHLKLAARLQPFIPIVIEIQRSIFNFSVFLIDSDFLKLKTPIICQRVSQRTKLFVEEADF